MGKGLQIQTLELSAGSGRDAFNVDKVLAGQKADLLEPLNKTGIEIASIAYGPNFLHPNEKIRKENLAYMRKVIEAAQSVEVPIVGCSVGACGGDIFQNLKVFEENYLPLVEFARDHGIKMAIENCPHGSENIACHPYIWEKLILESAKDFDNLGLEFDPSHLAWLQVDSYQALEDWVAKGKVFCCHAKDTNFQRHQFQKMVGI